METATAILVGSMMFSTPLTITALGGLFSEKSGVVNIGLEGMMTFGAFLGALIVYLLEPSLGALALPIGVIFGAIGGGIFGLLHAYLTVTVKGDQIICGTAINLLTLALAVYLCKAIFGLPETPMFLSNPVIIGTSVYLISIITIILVFATWFIINKTKWGLQLRACGEYPEAADSAGINVKKIRYQAVILSGIFAGMGGMFVVLMSAGNFTGTIISGMGFIALAVLISGKWHPLGILIMGLLFGILKSFSINAEILFVNLPIPSVIYAIAPYAITIVFIVIFSKNASAPAALGKPFQKE